MTSLSKKLFYVTLVFVFSLVFFGPFYTQDGPNHQKTALILSRLSQSPIEQKVYQSGFGLFETNTLFQLLYQPVSEFCTVKTYEKFFVATFLALLLISFRYFLKTLKPSNTEWWPLVSPTLFHPLYLRGFYNYLASVVFTLLALSLSYRKEKATTPSILLYFVLCWLCQLSHPFAFFILPLMIFVFSAQKGFKNWKQLLPYFVISCIFFVIKFVIPLFSSGIGNKTPYAFASIPILIGGLIGLNFMDYSILNLVIPLPFIASLIWFLRKNLKLEGVLSNLLWIAPLCAYLIFPRSGGGSAHMNERFLPYIFFFIPITLSEKLSFVLKKRILLVTWTTFILLSFGTSYGMYQLNQEASHAQHVMENLPKVSRLYPINFNLRGKAKINWHLAHIWATYPDDKIVFTPYLFALPNLTPLKKPLLNNNEYFPATEEDFPHQNIENNCRSGFLYDTFDCSTHKRQALEALLQDAKHYDYWFIHQAPQNFIDVLSKVENLEIVSKEGEYSLWHYKSPLPFSPEVP